MFNKKSNKQGQFFHPGQFNMPPYGYQQQSNPNPQEDIRGPMPGMPMQPPVNGMYPGMQFERLQFDIKENRRRINNLAKRIIRIENYLRIRDTSEYAILDEEQQVPPNFSM